MSKIQHDIRWQQRFDNLESSYQQLQFAVTENKAQPENQLIQVALIKIFEMTFELSWKTLQDYLKYQGIDTKTPRETIKQAFKSNIIENGELWIAMLDDRNLMVHAYNKVNALLAVEHICQRYLTGINQIYDYLRVYYESGDNENLREHIDRVGKKIL